jgi:hypothetical protein
MTSPLTINNFSSHQLTCLDLDCVDDNINGSNETDSFFPCTYAQGNNDYQLTHESPVLWCLNWS